MTTWPTVFISKDFCKTVKTRWLLNGSKFQTTDLSAGNNRLLQSKTLLFLCWRWLLTRTVVWRNAVLKYAPSVCLPPTLLHCGLHGHSRPRILVPVESPHEFLLVISSNPLSISNHFRNMNFK